MSRPVEIALGILLVATLYALVYYRLLVRWFLKEDNGIQETAWAALFTPPPWRVLSPLGKKYARRYFIALAILTALMAAIALTVGMPQIV